MPTQWLMIDAATQFGIKGTFEKRIDWTKTNLDILESLLPNAKEKPLYLKAVYAIRDTQAGKPTGHLVGLDASSSGIQIMSAVMGCKTGALNTGIVDPDKMPDAYTACTETMKRILGYSIDVSREDAKQALMVFFYGSEAKPKEIFEEGSPAYQAFFKAAKEVAPEAYDLRNILIGAWQPHALKHSWVMPDGFDVQIKVMQTVDVVVKVPELNSSFTHKFMENIGTEKGLSLAANVIHSIDGMIMREMCRRCNYDLDKLLVALSILATDTRQRVPAKDIDYTQFISINVIETMTYHSVRFMDINYLTRLEILLDNVLNKSRPFEIVGIHDEYKCHANNVDAMRYWYKEILAELADSHIMQDILRQIYNDPNIKLTRASENLGTMIRNSNYGIA